MVTLHSYFDLLSNYNINYKFLGRLHRVLDQVSGPDFRRKPSDLFELDLRAGHRSGHQRRARDRHRPGDRKTKQNRRNRIETANENLNRKRDVTAAAAEVSGISVVGVDIGVGVVGPRRQKFCGESRQEDRLRGCRWRRRPRGFGASVPFSHRGQAPASEVLDLGDDLRREKLLRASVSATQVVYRLHSLLKTLKLKFQET